MNRKILLIIMIVSVMGLSITVISVDATRENPNYPYRVTNLHTTEIRDTSVTFEWTAPTEHSQYPFNYYRITYNNGHQMVFDSSHITSKTITGLRPNTSYNFNVQTVNTYNFPSYHVGITVTTLDTLLNPPKNLVVTQPESDGPMRLSWLPGSYLASTSEATDYIIQYKDTRSSTWMTYNDGVDLIVTKDIPANLFILFDTYQFKVATLNEHGLSYYTEPVESAFCGNVPVPQTNPNEPRFGAFC